LSDAQRTCEDLAKMLRAFTENEIVGAEADAAA